MGPEALPEESLLLPTLRTKSTWLVMSTESPINKNRWQDNKSFVQWLLEQEYAELREERLFLFLSNGVALYMYEAWCAGHQEAKQPKPLECQCDVCRKVQIREKDDGTLLVR